LLGAAGVVGVVWGVVFSLDAGEVRYAFSVEEVLNAQKPARRSVRIQGCALPGSAIIGGEPCRVAFKLGQLWHGSMPDPAPPSIDVVYNRCDLPVDLTNWRFELSVDGRLVNQVGKRSIAAERVLTKCPGKYVVAGGPMPNCEPWQPCGHCTK
jgi:hypothetical protein